MRNRISPSLCLKLVVAIVACFAAITFCSVSHAGIRGRGKYSGVVVFDLWDTCFLLSGHFIMYIASDQKQRLRQFAGEAIQIKATDVFQPINPGDGLIRRFELVGLAPEDRYNPLPDGLKIEVADDFGVAGVPAFVITARNVGVEKIEVDRPLIGPTLLVKSKPNPFSPSDGKSVALITRIDLTTKSGSEKLLSHSASYAVDPACAMPEHFELGPGQKLSCRVIFKASPGQYQFMVGYGGGILESESLVSNAISFNIDQSGRAVLQPQ